MKQSQILKMCCDPLWYAKCYAEYMEDVSANIAKFKEGIEALLGEGIDYIDNQYQEDGLITENKMYYIIDDMITYFNNNTGFSFDRSSKLPISSGYVDMEALMNGLFKDCSMYYKIDDDSVESNIENSTTIGVWKYDLTVEKIKLDDVLGEIGDMINQAVVSSAGFKAMAFETVSDRLNTFKVYINDLSNINQYLQGANQLTTMYSTMIAESTDISVFLGKFLSLTDIETIASDDNTEVYYQDTDFSKYTGSSPAMAADFSSVCKAATSIMRTGAKVVKGVFQAGFKVVKGLFNKVSDYVADTLVDPEVLEYSGGSNCVDAIDGFQYQGMIDLYDSVQLVSCIDAQTRNEIINKYVETNSSTIGQWVQYDFIFADVMIKIDLDGDLLHYKLRLKTINPSSKFVEIIKAFEGAGNTLFQSPLDVLTYLNNNFTSKFNEYSIVNEIDGLYLNKNASKYDMIASLCCSSSCLANLVPFSVMEAISVLNDPTIQVNGYPTARVIADGTIINVNYSGTPSNLSGLLKSRDSDIPNNKNLVAMSSGYDYFTQSFGKSLYGIVLTDDDELVFSNGYIFGNINAIIGNLAVLVMLQAIDRHNNPTNYLFIPYTNNTKDFSPGKWRIKTDDDVQQAASKLIAAAILVVLAVAVGITAKIFLNKFKRYLTNKAFQRKAELDYLTSHGYPLTGKEMRQLRRANNRLKKAGFLSGGTSVVQSSKPEPTVQQQDNNAILYQLYDRIV